MKNTWNGELLHGMQELSKEDAAGIAGGESLWYWVGYAAGALTYMITHPTNNQTGGQKAMNAALG